MTSYTHIPDYEKWIQHFLRMAEGKVRRNAKGQYIVENIQQGGETKWEPRVKMITPIAAALDVARSQLQAEKEKEDLNRPWDKYPMRGRGGRIRKEPYKLNKKKVTRRIKAVKM